MPSLDEVLDGGIRPGEQCVIAGSPGMGKSALAQAIAVRMAIGGRPVLFVSLEMDRADVITRMLSHRTEIAFRKLRRPSSQSDQEAALVEDLTPHGLPMHVWFRPGASYDQVASMTRRLWMRGQCGALFVDYVQRMHHPRERGETLASAIGNTTTQFKQLAGELGIPVVVLSQLNRSFKAEPARRKAPQQGAHGWTLDVEVPSIDHLAESGRIEQDADIILFPLNAPNYGLEGKNSYGAIVVGKQRNGPRATVGVRWDGPCATYRPYGEGA
jgi:replicative DNA helicase